MRLTFWVASVRRQDELRESGQILLVSGQRHRFFEGRAIAQGTKQCTECIARNGLLVDLRQGKVLLMAAAVGELRRGQHNAARYSVWGACLSRPIYPRRQKRRVAHSPRQSGVAAKVISRATKRGDSNQDLLYCRNSRRREPPRAFGF